MSDDADARPIRKIDDASVGPGVDGPLQRRLLNAKRWFLLDGGRSVIAGLMLSGSFATILLVGMYGPAPAQSFVTAGVSPGSILVELLKAIVSVVVIVLSINQLVLSPGLGSVGDQQARYDQSIDLRESVEEQTETPVSPSSPAKFLTVLVNEIAEQAERVRDVAADSDADVADRADDWGASVVEEARAVESLLPASRFGRFEVVSAALRFTISDKVRALRAMERHIDETDEGLAEAFDELERLLELFTVSREYFKTIYIREEYVSLSEGLLYTGLPAVLLTYCAAQLYTPDVFPGALLGVSNRLLFVSAAVTVALSPFVLLISYVFRLAPLSRSTLFVGPFDAKQPGDEG